MKPLPKKYRILPYSRTFTVPGFDEQIGPNVQSLVPSDLKCEDWFEATLSKIENALGHEYLPVTRMSDGEFTFLLTAQPPSPREPPLRYIKLMGKWLGVKAKHTLGGGFRADTAAGVPSGRYRNAEWKSMREAYGEYIARLSRKGILALHLSYTTSPFQECFFPAFGKFLKNKQIHLTADNYCPFYFVYAFLVGSQKSRLLKGKRVLVVHSADGARRERITDALRREAVSSIQWLPISTSKSLFDRLDLKDVCPIDLALVGAGVGKPNILLQLEPLSVPCIDAGYIFEVWDNPANALRRPMAATDEELTRLRGLETI